MYNNAKPNSLLLEVHTKRLILKQGVNAVVRRNLYGNGAVGGQGSNNYGMEILGASVEWMNFEGNCRN